MRKIKAKPIKRLTFRPMKGAIVARVLPIEAALYLQERYDEFDRRQTWATILANLRGEPRDGGAA